tara:strand:+ start:51 stop:446 length:396 start_codon:yes stop_codon:yes gene_type:complete
MKCKICNKKTEHLELHHIIPKSRGGSDDVSNLIELCSECHGNAHDVSFTNDRGGLIKESIVKKLTKEKIDRKWLDNNKNMVHDKMMNLYNEDEDTHMLMLLLLEKNKFTPSRIREWTELGKVSFKTSFTFN